MLEPDLIGNALCLDFANTVNRLPEPHHDRLDSAAGLSKWARAAGIPSGVPRVKDARELREAVYRVFSRLAVDSEPEASDLAVISRRQAEGSASGELRRDGTRFTVRWPGQDEGPVLLWAVADSAVQLLRNGRLDRLGECPSCGWLFLDTSRNGKRRWCSMAVCGAPVKARRHYARKTGRASAPAAPEQEADHNADPDAARKGEPHRRSH